MSCISSLSLLIRQSNRANDSLQTNHFIPKQCLSTWPTRASPVLKTQIPTLLPTPPLDSDLIVCIFKDFPQKTLRHSQVLCGCSAVMNSDVMTVVIRLGAWEPAMEPDLWRQTQSPVKNVFKGSPQNLLKLYTAVYFLFRHLLYEFQAYLRGKKDNVSMTLHLVPNYFSKHLLF